MSRPNVQQTHSAGWIAQTWITFIVSVLVTGVGVYCLPVDPRVKGFMGMGILFTIGSTFSLAKTVRDQHESEKLVSRIDDARASKYLAEHDPLQKVG